VAFHEIQRAKSFQFRQKETTTKQKRSFHGLSETKNKTHLGLLVTAQFKVLASFQGQLVLVLAHGAFQSQDDLFRSLGFLVENRLGLTTETRLLAVITTLSLGKQRGLSGLVLSHLVGGVLAALLGRAEGVASLGNVDHFFFKIFLRFSKT
jgi:hypothetical protein